MQSEKRDIVNTEVWEDGRTGTVVVAYYYTDGNAAWVYYGAKGAHTGNPWELAQELAQIEAKKIATAGKDASDEFFNAIIGKATEEHPVRPQPRRKPLSTGA